jgi:hypothetical protein
MKNYRLILIIILAVIQLAVPAYLVFDKYDTLRNGVEIKLRSYPVDPYDAFRGRYVSLNVNAFSQNMTSADRENKPYGIIGFDDEGFAVIEELSEKPPERGLYVKSESKYYFSLPVGRYYMDEKLAPAAEIAVRGNQSQAYVTARIKKDKLVVSGLYIDGVPIEDYAAKK